MTERCCSFCSEPRHNIRTCEDVRIRNAYSNLIITWVLPRIGLEFTDDDRIALWGYLVWTMPRMLLYAVGVQYCQLPHRRDLFTHSTEISERIRNEHIYINTLDETQRDEWCIDVLGLPYEAFVPPVDPDSIVDLPEENIVLEEDNNLEVVTFYEDRTPTVLDVVPNHPVVEPFLLCLECSEELTESTECVICQDDKTIIDMTTTNCGHSFCHTCICIHIEFKVESPVCPLCRTVITSLETKDVEVFNAIDERFNRTVAILKDCSMMVFDYSNWASGHSEHEQIRMFLWDLDNVGLIERVNNATTNLKKAEHIWRYCYYNSPIKQNPEDVHSFDDLEISLDY